MGSAPTFVPGKRPEKSFSQVEQLGNDPRPIGCEKLTGLELYRIRQGNYRIVYSIRDNELTVWVVKVGNRENVYR
ncbi:MAG: type II toxin-antitoxin system RelE/ParE family toxin [Desulfatitalea sp.]|nr:type II toxin-antitoxin system RelE/ParE family toxin [Desulfatitalea sp.]